jgi:hypothetical protein
MTNDKGVASCQTYRCLVLLRYKKFLHAMFRISSQRLYFFSNVCFCGFLNSFFQVMFTVLSSRCGGYACDKGRATKYKLSNTREWHYQIHGQRMTALLSSQSSRL